jgi:hypothetical protein
MAESTQDFIDEAASLAIQPEGETQEAGIERIGGSLDASKSALESILATINDPNFSFSSGNLDSTGITSDSVTATGEDNTFLTNLEDLRASTGLSTFDEFQESNQILRDFGASQEAFREQQRAALAERFARTEESIQAGFDVQKQQTEFAQKRETGATGQALARAGGFLGVTGSQNAVLQNLAITQRQELANLEAKRQQALNEARNAFEDRDFELADSIMSDARDLERQIFDRSNTFQNQQLDLLGEQRAQFGAQREAREFDIRNATEQIDRFIEFGQTPSTTEIQNLAANANMDPNDLQALFTAGKASFDLLKKRDQSDDDIALIDILLDVPDTETVTIGGKQYQGLKDPTTGGAKASVTDLLKLQEIEDRQELMRSIVQDDITVQEAVVLFPTLDSPEIQEVFEILQGTDEEQLIKDINAGTKDLFIAGEEGDTFPIIIDKPKYVEALKAWGGDDKGTFFANDTTITYDGVTYRGPASTAPEGEDFETAESKAKAVE